MYRPTLLALALLATAACGDGTGPAFTDPDDLRLDIVSGDGQVGSVQDGGALRIAAVGPAGVLPDTLVARIKDKSGGHANVPPNTVVNYVVPSAGCGAPWVSATSPDDSAYVETLWERPAGKLPDLAWHDGVWGSACTLEARTAVDGVFKTDTMFSAIFTPGNASLVMDSWPGHITGSVPWRLLLPDSLIADAYGNTVPAYTESAWGDSTVTVSKAATGKWMALNLPEDLAAGDSTLVRFFVATDSVPADSALATVSHIGHDGRPSVWIRRL